MNDNKVSFSQLKHVAKLDKLGQDSVDDSHFVSQHACETYIASDFRPDMTFAFACASQVATLTKLDVKHLNKGVDLAKSNRSPHLSHIRLDPASLRIAVFVDANFELNANLSSEQGFVVTIAHKSNNANIVHYSSVKAKRVTCSVSAAELFALAHAFDSTVILHEAINGMLGREIALKMYNDSKLLYDAVVGINSRTEKRLLIDLTILCEAYKFLEIAEIVWVPLPENAVDAMTKDVLTQALSSLMKTSSLSISAKRWTEHTVENSSTVLCTESADCEGSGVSD